MNRKVSRAAIFSSCILKIWFRKAKLLPCKLVSRVTIGMNLKQVCPRLGPGGHLRPSDDFHLQNRWFMHTFEGCFSVTPGKFSIYKVWSAADHNLYFLNTTPRTALCFLSVKRNHSLLKQQLVGFGFTSEILQKNPE